MKQFKFWVLSIFTISVLLVSCGKTVDESLVLAEYLESSETTFDPAAINKLIPATELQTLVATQSAYIIDIRGEEYNTPGHIDGAVQVAPDAVLGHLESINFDDYEKVVIACYTGQTAAFVTTLANMAGYEVYSLAFGMSSWNAATAGPWNNSVSNLYETELETSANEKAAEGAMPFLETGFEGGADILDARIAVVNEEGFDAIKITAATVMDSPEDYYIVNYWPENEYNLGHIPGAIQYTPNNSMLTTADLKTLPADETIVVYCYTGQGSAFLTAYLRVLGYDAKSLLFGINGIATDWAATNELTAWGEGKISDYTLVTD
jgi:rhodanese-related sulfurtransferase